MCRGVGGCVCLRENLCVLYGGGGRRACSCEVVRKYIALREKTVASVHSFYIHSLLRWGMREERIGESMGMERCVWGGGGGEGGEMDSEGAEGMERVCVYVCVCVE